MEIDGRKVGDGELPYFIAEAGVNHNGSLERAENLVDAAAAAGSDAVKFQTFNTDQLVTQNAETADYQKQTTEKNNQYEMLEEYELSYRDHEQLIDYCLDQNITFLSTPFDRESANMLVDLDVPAIKLGSGELDNHPLLEHVAQLDLPIIVSTGMGTMKEVKQAYNSIKSTNETVDAVFLHCTSAYPTSIDDVNLRAMKTMNAELPVSVGYSDHTTNPETPALAVAAGACIVEKHFTLDSTLPGPDHEASLEPDELERAIELMQVASRARGSSKKRPVETELENRSAARKSLHAATEISSGTTLTESHIKIVRPAKGLSPSRYQSILGETLKTNLGENEPITDGCLAIEE